MRTRTRAARAGCHTGTLAHTPRASLQFCWRCPRSICFATPSSYPMASKRWGLRACVAGVGQFPVLVECLCAQKGFVHTSLALAEDDGGLVAGWCPSSRCVRAPCSHSLFYADRLACAGALRVPGFILIAHGSNGRVLYRPGDGCSACARVGTRDETNAGTRDQTRVCHGPDARDAVFCALAVGAAVACFANEATQPPTFVAWFDVRSSLSSRWQARSIDSPRELSS